MSVRAHLIIHGRVQGVFFRATALTEAMGRGLTGWVQNCEDGTVEIVCEGEPDEVKGFTDWCRRGPDGAEVIRVESTMGDAAGEFARFSIR